MKKRSFRHNVQYNKVEFYTKHSMWYTNIKIIVRMWILLITSLLRSFHLHFTTLFLLKERLYRYFWGPNRSEML